MEKIWIFNNFFISRSSIDAQTEKENNFLSIYKLTLQS